MSTHVERMTENEIMFREANERIERVGSDLAIAEPLPFLCECERDSCTDVLRLLPAQYERVRANSRAFIYAVGHEEGTAARARIISRNGGYLVLEKQGDAGEMAEATNPRDAAG
jgi:hypothetical protein